MKPFPPSLPTSAYIDQGWYEKEKNLLFCRLWQFFTFYNLVDKPNKFVAKKVFDIPVVVQNFDGELRAFENICLHRQAPIQSQPFGCRPLTCAYHGWNYGANGGVVTIPFEKEHYSFSPEVKAALCLKNFALERIGNLVFVNLSANPIPIDRQFSREFLDSLASVSAHFDNEMITTTFRRHFNWKLMFENLRDGLHPLFLHRDTLYRNVKFRPQAPQTEEIDAYLEERAANSNRDRFEEMRYFSKGGPDERLSYPKSYPWHSHVERFGGEDEYYNWLAFPNLHIASGTGGYSFIVAHYIPIGPAITDVDIYYLTARRKVAYDSSQAVLYEHLAGAEKVLDEDFHMLELIQNALHAGAPQPAWGAYELCNHWIATWISEVVHGRIAT